jgi:hypothetical protein
LPGRQNGSIKRAAGFFSHGAFVNFFSLILAVSTV